MLLYSFMVLYYLYVLFTHTVVTHLSFILVVIYTKSKYGVCLTPEVTLKKSDVNKIKCLYWQILRNELSYNVCCCECRLCHAWPWSKLVCQYMLWQLVNFYWKLCNTLPKAEVNIVTAELLIHLTTTLTISSLDLFWSLQGHGFRVTIFRDIKENLNTLHFTLQNDSSWWLT